MSVMARIAEKITSFPHSLETPSGKQFKITYTDGEKVLLETGRTPSIIKIPASVLEEAPNFLRGKGWISIGLVQGNSDGLSLDALARSRAPYVAPLLELAEIVEIDRSRPAKVRLKASY
jgi:hypothetical protein